MSDTEQLPPVPEQPTTPVREFITRPGAAKAAAAKAARPGLASVLLTLVLLVAMTGLGFYTWEHYKAIDVLFGQYNQLNQQGLGASAQLAEQNAAREQLGQNIADMQAQLLDAQALVAAQTARLDALNRELITSRLRINDSGAGASQVWMLSEAESLLRFAQQRLLLARDVRTAIGLFVASDDLLEQINDPAVFAVREALALDLGALQAVQEADVPGIYARIGAMIQSLDGLQVQRAGGQLPASTAAITESTGEETAQSWWAKAGASLGQYFVISREVGDAVPQLNTEQAWALKEMLRLNLEQARVALIRGQADLFQLTLAEARQGIVSFGEEGTNAAILAELDAVSQLPILTVVPPVNLALTALRQLRPAGNLNTEVSP